MLIAANPWLGDSIDDRDQVHIIIMPDYFVLELESFVDRLYCHTPVPPDDPASTSNNHHGIEVKDEVKDDYSSDEAILCDVTYTDLSHVKMSSLISTSVSQLLNDF